MWPTLTAMLAIAVLMQHVACRVTKGSLRATSSEQVVAETSDAVDLTTGEARPGSAEPYRMLLHNHEDVQYVGDFYIGGQRLRGVIDTGSFELLVFSKQCELCGDKRRLYNHEKSVNFMQGELEMKHSFGSGDTWSHEASDLVEIGPLRAENQSFWEVRDSAMPVLRTAHFQAIVGLGPAESATKLAEKHAKDATKAKEDLLREGKKVSKEVRSDYRQSKVASEHAKHKISLSENLNMRVFSICMSADRGEPGYFIWNDTHPSSYPAHHPVHFAKIEKVGTMHWSVEMRDVRIGHSEYGSGQAIDLGCSEVTGPCGAVLDSGTSLIAAPKEAIALVAKALESLNGDCSKLEDLPDLHFTIDGNDFSLPPESYVGQVVGTIPAALREILAFSAFKVGSRGRRSRKAGLNLSAAAEADAMELEPGSVCQPLLMAVDAKTQFGPMWILGLPFFRRYYTTFETRPAADPEMPLQRSVFTALADDQCRPSVGTSLLGAPRRKRHFLRVDPSEIHVPRWVSDAVIHKQLNI